MRHVTPLRTMRRLWRDVSFATGWIWVWNAEVKWEIKRTARAAERGLRQVLLREGRRQERPHEVSQNFKSKAWPSGRRRSSARRGDSGNKKMIICAPRRRFPGFPVVRWKVTKTHTGQCRSPRTRPRRPRRCAPCRRRRSRRWRNRRRRNEYQRPGRADAWPAKTVNADYAASHAFSLWYRRVLSIT